MWGLAKFGGTVDNFDFTTDQVFKNEIFPLIEIGVTKLNNI